MPLQISPTQIDVNLLASRILIADDEPLVCRLLAGILKRQQFSSFCIATGGNAALEQVEAFRPDIILLDVQMPDVGGIEVCQRIRTNPAWVDIPILVHSATFDREAMGVLFAAGASDFVSKPINPFELVSRVTLHLERRKSLRDLREYRVRTSQELEAARRMQFELLPTPPDQLRIATAAKARIRSYSRSSSEIGGDLWGILPAGETAFSVFLADFAGHGVTAALNTFRLHALIHEHRNLHQDPSGFLAMLNERLVRMLSPGQFATFLHVVFEPAADRLRFASAGASPPIISNGRCGETELVEAAGLPLGVVRGVQYELHERPFPAGSTLFMFSDGLAEFPNPEGQRIGDEGLRQVLADCDRGMTPYQIIDHACRATGVGADQALPDDITVVCVDRRSDAAELACHRCQLRTAPPQPQPEHTAGKEQRTCPTG